MSIVSDKKTLMKHLGHKLEVNYRGARDDPNEATIECLTCGCTLYEEPDNYEE